MYGSMNRNRHQETKKEEVMRKWEYSMIQISTALKSSAHFINSQGVKTKINGVKDEDIMLHFNRLGNDGWDLIDSVSHVDPRHGAATHKWVFKRSIEE